MALLSLAGRITCSRRWDRQLSARGRDLVTLIARRRTDIQIAAEPFISVCTVGSHLDRIRDKTFAAAKTTCPGRS